MQDIDDFDPLDDILLSDEEPVDPKNIILKKPSIFQKPKEISAVDDLSKEDKKKRVLAELFGTKHEPEKESKEEPSKQEETAISQTKYDWLDLKAETKSTLPESTSNKTVTWKTPAEKSLTFIDDTNKNDNFGNKLLTAENDDIFSVSQTSIPRITETSDRRKSESSAQSDSKKSKQRFKSLDLDLDFDFDQPNEAESSKNVAVKTADEDMKKNTNQETTKRDVTELFYVPSIGNRRSGTPKGRSQIFDSAVSSSFLVPDHSQNVVNSDSLKDSLPTWLEPKKNEVRSAPTISRSDKLNYEKLGKSEGTVDGRNISEVKDNLTLEAKSTKIDSYVESDVLSTVLELKKKQEELKNIAKAQTNSLIRHEQEIQNSAAKLMLQHRSNMNALMQIISPDSINSEFNEKLDKDKDKDLQIKIENFENNVSQLQMKLIQQELEKSELQLKLEYAEKKYSTDLNALEDLYGYKLQVAKEKENHLKMEIQNIEEEYTNKLQRRKENENEIISSYKEKIRIMQEEHLNEMKYIADYRGVRSSSRKSETELMNADISNEKTVSKEFTTREIALENRRRELLELEDELNKQKLALEGKSTALNTRMEEFEARSTKQKLAVEQQKKDLKLSQLILEEKELSWEKEKQREKDYLQSYKQELENMKENLLKEEKKLMKEKFEISTEKARIEAILNLDGTPGQINNVLLNKAELQGTLEEVNRLKEKLQLEREEIKKEERRLKEESWKLKEIEQQLMLQNKHYQKLLKESEMKQEEGIQALKKAQKIESQMNERIEEIENRLSNLRRKEEQLTHEKIEVSKERDLINKKRYQLDMILPELTYDEQLPFNIMSRGIIDPKIMIMKWKAENDMDSLFGH
ncbi:fas-binding factor 1-like isoform X2 [Planococcus citri]|uniref:fas-binding factor 1-like isoform X2 n=1 Tax=Planococcus citri TaxID=170843 RepID=UPI0031F75DCE